MRGFTYVYMETQDVKFQLSITERHHKKYEEERFVSGLHIEFKWTFIVQYFES